MSIQQLLSFIRIVQGAFLFGIAYVVIRYPESNQEIKEVRIHVATAPQLKETRYAGNSFV